MLWNIVRKFKARHFDTYCSIVFKELKYLMSLENNPIVWIEMLVFKYSKCSSRLLKLFCVTMVYNHVCHLVCWSLIILYQWMDTNHCYYNEPWMDMNHCYYINGFFYHYEFIMHWQLRQLLYGCFKWDYFFEMIVMGKFLQYNRLQLCLTLMKTWCFIFNTIFLEYGDTILNS